MGLLPLDRGLGSSSCGIGESLLLARWTCGDGVLSIYMQVDSLDGYDWRMSMEYNGHCQFCLYRNNTLKLLLHPDILYNVKMWKTHLLRACGVLTTQLHATRSGGLGWWGGRPLFPTCALRWSEVGCRCWRLRRVFVLWNGLHLIEVPHSYLSHAVRTSEDGQIHSIERRAKWKHSTSQVKQMFSRKFATIGSNVTGWMFTWLPNRKELWYMLPPVQSMDLLRP